MRDQLRVASRALRFNTVILLAMKLTAEPGQFR
jgi:hypothetical protein